MAEPYEQEIQLIDYLASMPSGVTADVLAAKGVAYVSRAIGLMLDEGLLQGVVITAVTEGLSRMKDGQETEAFIETGEIDARSFVFGMLFTFDNQLSAIVHKRVPGNY